MSDARVVFRARRVVLVDRIDSATIHVVDGVIERVGGYDDIGDARLIDVALSGRVSLVPLDKSALPAACP